MGDSSYDVIVIGGGFFGSMVAAHLGAQGMRTLLAEREADLLQRASYANQARVHNGYHYPRSLITALRSHVNFHRFVEDFADCVESNFEKYYAIARDFSQVTAAQFELFCHRLELPLRPAGNDVRSLFDPGLVEAVYCVREYAFHAGRLKEFVRGQLQQTRVDVRLETEVHELCPHAGRGIEVRGSAGNGPFRASAHWAFNCTYAGLNQVLERSGLQLIPLKYEYTEMPLLAVPEPLRRIGITVMCGPFFSVMPFPAAGLHTLSHVRYTPHFALTQDSPRTIRDQVCRGKLEKASHYRQMLLDVQRYLPVIGQSQYVAALWETKVILPANENDDGRPILIRRHDDLPGLYSVLGSKIDNIYDALDRIDGLLSIREAG